MLKGEKKSAHTRYDLLIPFFFPSSKPAPLIIPSIVLPLKYEVQVSVVELGSLIFPNSCEGPRATLKLKSARFG